MRVSGCHHYAAELMQRICGVAWCVYYCAGLDLLHLQVLDRTALYGKGLRGIAWGRSWVKSTRTAARMMMLATFITITARTRGRLGCAFDFGGDVHDGDL